MLRCGGSFLLEELWDDVVPFAWMQLGCLGVVGGADGMVLLVRWTGKGRG